MRMTEGLQRRESSRVLLAANNTPISMLGEVDVDIRVAGRISTDNFPRIRSNRFNYTWIRLAVQTLMPDKLRE